MNKQAYRIGILGLDPSDALALRSILRLTHHQLRQPWQFNDGRPADGQHTDGQCVDGQYADVLVINPQYPDLKTTLQRMRQAAISQPGRARASAPFHVSLLRSGDTPLAGSAVIKSPLRAKDVINLLRDYEQRAQTGDAAGSAAGHILVVMGLSEEAGADTDLVRAAHRRRRTHRERRCPEPPLDRHLAAKPRATTGVAAT